MQKLAIMVALCCLAGCGARSDDPLQKDAVKGTPQEPLSFRQQQQRLFSEIDHKLVYRGCQEVMRLHREGRLSASTYYHDDPPAKLSELPEPIRALHATSVHVNEIMLDMTFLSEDGVQHLRCISDEFGEHATADEEPKGFGFRTNPYAMDKLSGTESLDYLNANYKHFEINLIPGLTYQLFPEDRIPTQAEVKQRGEASETMLAFMREAMSELAVKKQRLLYRTDHHKLLEASWESIRRFNEGAFSAAKVDILPEGLLEVAAHIDREKYARDLKQIPQIILDLEPVYIWFERNRVMVALIGGLDHAGVLAYLNDEDAMPGDDDMELIAGLRYYDDGLREAGADYEDYLKSLEHEAIPPIDWQRKRMNLPIPERGDSSDSSGKR